MRRGVVRRIASDWSGRTRNVRRIAFDKSTRRGVVRRWGHYIALQMKTFFTFQM